MLLFFPNIAKAVLAGRGSRHKKLAATSREDPLHAATSFTKEGTYKTHRGTIPIPPAHSTDLQMVSGVVRDPWGATPWRTVPT
eukprot:3873439-Amphidinium_carterae.2